MSVVQISQIKHRRGVESDLPQLASAELGWSVDTQQLYIGNGTLAEGAPEVGNTRILTENDLPFANNSVYGQSLPNATTTDIAYCQFDATMPSVTFNYSVVRVVAPSNTAVRTGTLRIAQYENNMAYDESYVEASTSGVTFSVTQVANSYSIISATLTNTGYDAQLKYSFNAFTF